MSKNLSTILRAGSVTNVVGGKNLFNSDHLVAVQFQSQEVE